MAMMIRTFTFWSRMNTAIQTYSLLQRVAMCWKFSTATIRESPRDTCVSVYLVLLWVKDHHNLQSISNYGTAEITNDQSLKHFTGPKTFTWNIPVQCQGHLCYRVLFFLYLIHWFMKIRTLFDCSCIVSLMSVLLGNTVSSHMSVQ